MPILWSSLLQLAAAQAWAERPDMPPRWSASKWREICRSPYPEVCFSTLANLAQDLNLELAREYKRNNPPPKPGK